MRITVTGRHMDVNEAVRSYAEEKASKLSRYYDRLQSVEVIFDHQAGHHFCEVIAKGDHHTTFVAKERHADLQASLDVALKELERQLTRHKEKFRNRKHMVGPGEREPLADGEPGEQD